MSISDRAFVEFSLEYIALIVQIGSIRRPRRQRPALASTSSSSQMEQYTMHQTRDSWAPTSTPLQSNFDATRYDEEGEDERRTWAPTSTPLRSDFDAMTYAHEHEAESVAPSSKPNPNVVQHGSRRYVLHLVLSGYTSDFPISEYYYGLDVTAPATYQDRHLATDYPEYMEEMQELFGEHKDLNITQSPSRVHPSPGASNLHRSQTKGSTTTSKQDFEVVGNTILEDGPEKTVTISTWRERVARESKDKGQAKSEMSVYYVSPNDYSIEEEKLQQEAQESSMRELTPESWNGRSPAVRIFQHLLMTMLTGLLNRNLGMFQCRPLDEG